MTKVFFATNRKSDDPSHVGGFGANIVGLNPNEITFASVEVARTVLADEDSGEIGPILNETPGKFADPDVQEIIASNKNVLVFIHGFANSFEDAIKRAAFNADWFRSSGAAAADTTIVAFTWPSLGGVFAAPPYLPAHNYYTDQTQAGRSGFHISYFLHYIEGLRARLDPKTRVFLLAHSMGNFALQAGVQSWFTDGGQAAAIFDEAILPAADERSDSFEMPAGGRLTDLPELTKRTTIYYSINDIAMHLSLALNLRDRIGFDGPDHMHDPKQYPPDKFRMVECSEVRDYSWIDPPDATHQYYRRSPVVLFDIASVMSANAQPPGGITSLTTEIDISNVGPRTGV